jgi:hypothetical protein
MSRELFSQIIAPLNKGVNQQADSLMLPGFAKSLENGVCDLVEGLKKRLGSVPLKRIDTLTKNAVVLLLLIQSNGMRLGCLFTTVVVTNALF